MIEHVSIVDESNTHTKYNFKRREPNTFHVTFDLGILYTNLTSILRK
jgi:hypothetical protein